MDSNLKQRYSFNDLSNLCYWYIENSVNEINDILIYQNTKMYDVCNEYILNGCKFTSIQKQNLLDFFNRQCNGKKF